MIYTVMVARRGGALTEIWGGLQRAAAATDGLVEPLAGRRHRCPIPRGIAAPPAPRQTGHCRLRDMSAFTIPRGPVSSPPSTDQPRGEAPGEDPWGPLSGPSGRANRRSSSFLLRFLTPRRGGSCSIGWTCATWPGPDFRCANHRAGCRRNPGDLRPISARETSGFGLAPKPSVAEVRGPPPARRGPSTFLPALPEGYDSYVGERGVMLSGRAGSSAIAIARRDPAPTRPCLCWTRRPPPLMPESERLGAARRWTSLARAGPTSLTTIIGRRWWSPTAPRPR